MEELKKGFFESMVSEETLHKTLVLRAREYVLESIQYELKEKYLQNGWVVNREFKTKCRMIRDKPSDIAFEDEMWALFGSLGFKFMNRDRNFVLAYSDDQKSTQQIDVIAIDDETIIIIECKASEKTDKKRTFKNDIEALAGKKQGIVNWLRKIFPGVKHKIKFVFATKNYILNSEDLSRLNSFNILHFDETALKYYQNLYEHLGMAAKYQILGTLFEGEEIPLLDNVVPAIKGKMGSHTYYSFSIEPEKLLKIGFVLHRNKANKKMMPTYQRMIKKSRLKSIENFINEGGYFGNSVIINIETDKGLRFDRANTQSETSIAKIGLLHLPKKYKSAFIIDGQHRIYGYANTKYRITNSIPVVAFENLDRTNQIEIFMQINENQKAIPKNLKNTLNADLLWDSKNLVEALRASRLQLSIDLGEDKESTLYGRIIIGEDIKTKKTCITLDTISIALNKTNFYGKVTKDSIKEIGTFYNGNIEKSHDKIFYFLIGCFDFIQENLMSDWELGEKENGYLTINATVYMFILLLNDIVNHLNETQNFDAKNRSVKEVIDSTVYYLDPVIKHFKNLTVEEKQNYRKSYGHSGRTEYWHKIQQVIHDSIIDFNPITLLKYQEEKQQFLNDLAIKYIRGIETHLKKVVKEKIETHFGKNWWKKGIPVKVYTNAEALASQKNRDIEDEEKEIDPWDCLHIIDYRDIITHNKSWILKEFTRLGDEQLNTEGKTEWLSKFNKIRNENVHSWKGLEDEIKFLEEIHNWLTESEIDENN